MLAGGLLAERRQGRHRYLELAGPHVAHLIEDLRRIPPPSQRTAGRAEPDAARRHASRPRWRAGAPATTTWPGDSAWRSPTRSPARACSTRTARPSPTTGRTWLTAELGVPPEALRPGRRPLARACLDWTERRPHLAGVAGARICTGFLERRWITRIGTGRAVRVTPSGATALHTLLDLTANDLS